MQDEAEETTNNAHDATIDQDRNESTPLYSNVLDIDALKLIVSFFFGFTVTVTIALAVQIYYGNVQVVIHGSVVSDSGQCSLIGGSILKEGGNAVDAAIATAFCMGVVNPHITGLGSGGYMLIYDQRERKALGAIDFRVTRSTHPSIGVPGFVAGLALAHELYGILPWKRLVLPAKFMAEYPFPVTPSFLKAMYSQHSPSRTSDSKFREFLISLTQQEPNPQLSQILDHIANFGSTEYYREILPKTLFGLVDAKDIANYKAVKVPVMKNSFLQYDIIVPGRGSGGPYLIDNLASINNTLPPLVSVVEAFKNIFVKQDWSTCIASHIATMDINDLYVTMVSSLGFVLGSQIVTEDGFILNNMLEMTNDHRSNRPEILLTPLIATQSGRTCGRRLLLGAGDVREVAQPLVYFIRDPSANISRSVEAPRVQIKYPKVIEDDDRPISQEDYIFLANDKTINIVPSKLFVFSSINAIEKVNDTIIAHADSRGYGNNVTF